MEKTIIAPLLEPLTVRGVTLPNRVVMSPMSRTASPDGIPGAALAEYYGKRAEGGVGTIFTEGARIEHPGAIGDLGLGDSVAPYMWSEPALAGWRRVVERVHGAGGLIFPQLMHLGVMKRPGSGGAFREDVIAGPSGIWGATENPLGVDAEGLAALDAPGRALDDAEVAAIIEAFAVSAANAKAVGFDGIALHGGHGYLIDNFLWGGTNRRADQWGGDAVERTRFAVEVVRAVRAAVGGDMPISFRFSQWKPQDLTAHLGATPQELERVLGPIADAGIDIFEASTRDFSEPAFAGSPLSLAGWTRKLTGTFTAMVGGTAVHRERFAGTMTPPTTIDNLADVMERHARGEFDLLQVGRALLNDPQWLVKARRGEPFLPFDPACFTRID
ncbi:MAG: 12-oxophytodienoate reductase [Novosphingobium sp.]|nr:12-oxophytodienoate reductase [Novosphingobium sp.]